MQHQILIPCITNMKIFVLCMIISGMAMDISSGKVVLITRWQDGADDPKVVLNREDILEAVNTLYMEKHPLQLDGLPEQVKRIVNRKEPSLQTRSMSKSLCSCETQYEIRDLGEGHYPRYLTASRCKPKACQDKFNSCNLLHYMVHVLKRRDLNGMSEDHYSEDDTLPETPLPESLRQKWQLKPMSIAVACVPATDIRRI